ncbi:Pre-rRNA-processing protein TSR2 [Phytophthora citrophthora]|uniref:Pre-rRNA-processing protein TSR2 n=1 Tax=Phytophthora citrophthora TaxID=4793 RepID=A0AAD9GVH2_9STRA|nr:Pre-rRNA-processing protein TSR2 [Phytophthora citrophthora]
MSGIECVLLSVAREHSEQFAAGTIKSPWDYFEYSVKLALARWTALRMAIEGEWGGGDTRRKYEILLEEILNVFKYNKNVYADAMADNIGGYVESEFGLICEDGSVEEVAELLTILVEECKKSQYDRVKAMHDQVQSLFPIDLKAAKLKRQDDGVALAEGSSEALGAISEEAGAGMQEPDEPLVDEDGFTMVRRSGRRKAPTKFYDPSAEFPGAA